jgi:hypothetical protein
MLLPDGSLECDPVGGRRNALPLDPLQSAPPVNYRPRVWTEHRYRGRCSDSYGPSSELAVVRFLEAFGIESLNLLNLRICEY